MAEPFTYNFRILTGTEEKCGACVTEIVRCQIVEPDRVGGLPPDVPHREAVPESGHAQVKRDLKLDVDGPL